MFTRIRIGLVLAILLLGIVTISIPTAGQTPGPTGPVMRFTATTVNVSGAPDSIRIDVLRWSTDMDRDQLLAAWNLTAPAAGARGGAGDGGGRGARGGGGRGADPAAGGAAPANPPAAGGAPPAAAADAGRGGGGRGGAGGRGGRGADAGAAPARQTPEAALASALQTRPTIGYLWSSESTGYSLKYAYRVPQTGGGERIIFATDRRLGVWVDRWKPTGGVTPPEYEFSVVELRMPAKGDGEGKASISGKVAVDSTVNSLALDNYTALPVVLKEVKRR